MNSLIIDGRQFKTTAVSLFAGSYSTGKVAHRKGEDTHALFRQLLAQGDHAALAGYLHGLAVAARERMPQHTVNCPCPHCVHDREVQTRRAYQVWQEEMAA